MPVQLLQLTHWLCMTAACQHIGLLDLFILGILVLKLACACHSFALLSLCSHDQNKTPL